jgi:hypothetical protein
LLDKLNALDNIPFCYLIEQSVARLTFELKMKVVQISAQIEEQLRQVLYYDLIVLLRAEAIASKKLGGRCTLDSACAVPQGGHCGTKHTAGI